MNQQIAQPKICPICNKPMLPMIPKSFPEKGEWWCVEDRKSIRMEEVGEAAYWSAS